MLANCDAFSREDVEQVYAKLMPHFQAMRALH